MEVKVNQPPPVPQEPTFSIEGMTRDEAEMLRLVTGSIRHDPLNDGAHELRTFTDNIYSKLGRAGVESPALSGRSGIFVRTSLDVRAYSKRTTK